MLITAGHPHYCLAVKLGVYRPGLCLYSPRLVYDPGALALKAPVVFPVKTKSRVFLTAAGVPANPYLPCYSPRLSQCQLGLATTWHFHNDILTGT